MHSRKGSELRDTRPRASQHSNRSPGQDREGSGGGGRRVPHQTAAGAPQPPHQRPAPPRRQAAGHAPALGAPPREQAGPGRRASFRRPSGPGPRPAPARAAGPASRGRSSKRTPGPPDPRPQNSGPPRPRRRHQGGRAAPWGAKVAPSAAPGRAGPGLTPEGAGPPDSTRRPGPAGAAGSGRSRRPSASPSLQGLLLRRSPPDSAPAACASAPARVPGPPIASDSLTAALRSATELRAPPSRRPDQQMGGAAPPPGFHWTGRRGAVPADGRSPGSLLPGLLPLRGSGGRLASLVSSARGPPSALPRCPE